MLKTYCDICGGELTKKNEPTGGRMVESRLGVEIRRNGHEFKFEIMASADGTANKGDICKYCVLDAIYRLDDRSAPATAA